MINIVDQFKFFTIILKQGHLLLNQMVFLKQLFCIQLFMLLYFSSSASNLWQSSEI